VLGISEDAVRMRIKRGTLAADKQGGRLYVYLTTDPTTEPTPDRTDALIAELQDRVRSLEDANRENRRIIAALTSRIPQLEAPREAPGDAETATEAPEGSERQRRQHAEEEAATLRAQLRILSEARESSESPGPSKTPPDAPAAPQTAAQRPQSGGLRGWRRRILGW
jgi:hypothetical protein